MIAPSAKFYFQPPYLDPTCAVLVPELIDGNGGREQPLVGSVEHLIHLLSRGGQKYTDMLSRHTLIQFQQAQHAIKRGEWV
jgi:hypothetical protein